MANPVLIADPGESCAREREESLAQDCLGWTVVKQYMTQSSIGFQPVSGRSGRFPTDERELRILIPADKETRWKPILQCVPRLEEVD
jgi:hypothetical protein